MGRRRDWWCNRCDFNIFGRKNKCFKCGLLRTETCCISCKYVQNDRFNKCPECSDFYGKDGEYLWRKENGGLEEFINKNPEYNPCQCRICGDSPRRWCWNY